MSVAYQAVGWNRQKKIYDWTLAGGCGLYLAIFMGASLAGRPEITAETLTIRAFGSLALLLLHVVLVIGPLCRLDRRFLPLLYNRRHLGVTMFLAALVHGVFSLVQFHVLGTLNPLVNVLVGNSRYDSLHAFPFQPLGLAALVILFLMAATSHDFWLANLTAPVWKALHMSVYVAYVLVIAHVALGILQVERHPFLVGGLVAGFVTVFGLHLIAGWRERAEDHSLADQGFVDVCAVDDIPENRACTVSLAGERVAVFRYDGKVSALSNACKHQNGPLGEGKVVEGCVVCPWHGYQYLPDSGQSPPPFTEKVPTFEVRVENGRVLVNATPLAPGTRVEPAACGAGCSSSTHDTSEDSGGDFYTGYLPTAPPAVASRVRQAVAAMLVVAVGAAVGVALLQQRFAPSVFEFGSPRSVEGVIQASPHPILHVTDADGGPTHYLLVAEGKHGADADVAAFDGRPVRLSGTPIYRGDEHMLEVVASSVEVRTGALDPSAADLAVPSDAVAISHGRHTLQGEIVDSKCYLGVMKPGEYKVHRACATLCIRGGIPPLFVVRDGEQSRTFLLTGDDGRAINQHVLDVVAEPVSASGEIKRAGEQWIFAVDPATIERL